MNAHIARRPLTGRTDEPRGAIGAFGALVRSTSLPRHPHLPVVIRQHDRYHGRMPLIEHILRAVEGDPRTAGRIADEAGVARSVLSRLRNGERGISVDTAETLARELGYEIVLKRTRARRGKGR